MEMTSALLLVRCHQNGLAFPQEIETAVGSAVTPVEKEAPLGTEAFFACDFALWRCTIRVAVAVLDLLSYGLVVAALVLQNAVEVVLAGAVAKAVAAGATVVAVEAVVAVAMEALGVGMVIAVAVVASPVVAEANDNPAAESVDEATAAVFVETVLGFEAGTAVAAADAADAAAAAAAAKSFAGEIPAVVAAGGGKKVDVDLMIDGMTAVVVAALASGR